MDNEEKLVVHDIEYRLPIKESATIREILNKEMTEKEIFQCIQKFKADIRAEVTLYSVPKRSVKGANNGK